MWCCAIVSPCCHRAKPGVRHGRLPERPMGADCKSVGVFLRRFESCTCHPTKTAPDQRKRWTRAVSFRCLTSVGRSRGSTGVRKQAWGSLGRCPTWRPECCLDPRPPAGESCYRIQRNSGWQIVRVAVRLARTTYSKWSLRHPRRGRDHVEYRSLEFQDLGEHRRWAGRLVMKLEAGHRLVVGSSLRTRRLRAAPCGRPSCMSAESVSVRTAGRARPSTVRRCLPQSGVGHRAGAASATFSPRMGRTIDGDRVDGGHEQGDALTPSAIGARESVITASRPS